MKIKYIEGIKNVQAGILANNKFNDLIVFLKNGADESRKLEEATFNDVEIKSKLNELKELFPDAKFEIIKEKKEATN